MQLVIAESPANQLWREMKPAVAPFPKGVEGVLVPIPGTAFFPGGYGLWLEENERRPFPTGQIMVVGQDFNSVKAYTKARDAGTEVNIGLTWNVLKKILPASVVSLDRCFFTNLYMGLRKDGKETGKFPGARDPEFVARCLEFFKRQLEIVRPKLLLTLGVEPFRVLANNNFIQIQKPFPKTLTACTEIYSLHLEYGSATLVALTHPSLYAVNVRHRKYLQLIKAEAESAMIREGLQRANS